jgi:hypothetical protein
MKEICLLSSNYFSDIVDKQVDRLKDVKGDLFGKQQQLVAQLVINKWKRKKEILWYSIHINCINKGKPKIAANMIEIGTILTSLPPHVNFTDRVSLNRINAYFLNSAFMCGF